MTSDQLMLFTHPPKLRGVHYRHIPNALYINRHNLKTIEGQIKHRNHDTTSTPGKRGFLADEIEVGERAAARLMVHVEMPS